MTKQVLVHPPPFVDLALSGVHVCGKQQGIIKIQQAPDQLNRPLETISEPLRESSSTRK
jgi:hypothetical protein